MLPLGTGNDLSRVLGWGEGQTGDVDVDEFLRDMKQARVVKLDRCVKAQQVHESVMLRNKCSSAKELCLVLSLQVLCCLMLCICGAMIETRTGRDVM